MKLADYIDPSDTSSDFGISNGAISLTQNSLRDHNLLWIRPNNYAIYATILKNSEDCHLPIRKISGKSMREYEYNKRSTVERTSHKIIVYARGNWSLPANTPEQVAESERKIMNFLEDEMINFQQRYPLIQLDIEHCQRLPRRGEAGLKGDEALDRIPRKMRFQTAEGKKVYDEEWEFWTWKEKGGMLPVAQYIKSRTIEDWAPELKKEMDFIISQQVQFAKNLELHLQVLGELRSAVKEMNKPKQSILSRIYFFLRRRKHDT